MSNTKTKPIITLPVGSCEACNHAPRMYELNDLLGKVTYKVCGNCLLKLVIHSLSPEEFRGLIASGHHENEFYLHEDFYDEEGNALQPFT